MQPARAAVVVVLLIGLVAAPALLPATRGPATAAAATAATQAGDAANGNETVVGAVVSQTPAAEEELLAAADAAAGRTVSLPADANATRLFARSGSYVLVTDRPVDPGLATVQGAVVGDDRPTGPRVLVAESVSVQTSGDPVSFDAVDSDPGRYEWRLVSFRATVSATSALGGVSERPEQRVLGAAERDAREERLLRLPGRVARAALFDGELPLDPRRRAAGGAFELLSNQSTFWGQAPATVEGVVLPNRSLAVAEAAYRGRTVPGVDAVRTRNLTGSVVTFETELAGRRASVRDAMLAADRCAPDSVARPSRGDVCTAIDTDVALHAGVLFGDDADTRTETLPYVGLSAAVPDETVTVDGRYRVTGRVVERDVVDPRLPDSRALLLYDAEPVSGGDGDVPGRVDRWAGLTLDLFRSQATMGLFEWDAAVTATRGFVSGTDQPDAVVVERTTLPERVDAGAPVNLTVTLSSAADDDRSVVLEARENDTVYDVANVTVAAGRSRTVTLRFAVYEAGRHDITLNGQPAGTLRVDTVQTTTTDGQSGLGPLVALLALAALLVGARRPG
jgi:plastocyanin